MDKKEQQEMVRRFSLAHSSAHANGKIMSPKCDDCGRTVSQQKALKK